MWGPFTTFFLIIGLVVVTLVVDVWTQDRKHEQRLESYG